MLEFVLDPAFNGFDVLLMALVVVLAGVARMAFKRHAAPAPHEELDELDELEWLDWRWPQNTGGR